MALLAQPDYEDYPGNHGISIVLNDPAHPGQLRAQVTYLPANPNQFDSGISVGNFTGTKSLDIVTTTAGNYGTGDNVLVLPSDPAYPGAFLPFTSTPLPANSQIFGLVTSDLNGDGYADVAVADEDQTKAASENPFFVGVLRPSDAGLHGVLFGCSGRAVAPGVRASAVCGRR